MIGLVARLLRRLAGRRPDQVAALPWRDGPDGPEILLITSRQTRRWIIPKGWPMRGRSDPEAAAREAFEEAGVEGEIDSRGLGRFHYGKRLKDGRVRRCSVEVFPLRVTRLLDSWPEQAQRMRRWARPEEASAAVQEPELRELLRRFRPGAGDRAGTPA